MKDRHGMNFSYGALATLMKYPWGSSSKNAKMEKKIGYFSSEEPLVRDILSTTGMMKTTCHMKKQHYMK